MLSQIVTSDVEAESRVEWVMARPDVSEEELAESMRRVIEGEEFSDVRETILKFIKNGELDQAIGTVVAIQRAATGAFAAAFYNPFRVGPYSDKQPDGDKDT